MRKLALLAATGFLLAGCGGSSKPSASKPDANGCVPVGNVLQTPRTATKPKVGLDPAKTYDVTLVTNCGNFTIRMDQKQSPNATASFVGLAKRGFFDRTVFHRIVPGFVIQGGDPTGTGTGGPGYRTVDKPPTTAKYTHGIVAMAKTATERPGTAGSQFFVVTAPDAQLTPDYAIVGKVVRGLTVVDRIGKLGDSNEVPTETVEIERARVHVSGVIPVVVLAAGASSRFGSPKQRLLLPAVLARLGRAPIGRVVVVEGAHPLADVVSAPAEVVRCPEWRRGPGASLRCGLAALEGEAEGALVVLADGPGLDPRAIERVLAHRREADVLAAGYGGVRGHPVWLARPVWAWVPDEGMRAIPARLVPCDDLEPPGDVDYSV